MDITTTDAGAENGKLDPVSNNSQTEDFSRDVSFSLMDHDQAPTFATQVQQINQNNVTKPDTLPDTGTQVKARKSKGSKKNSKEHNESNGYKCKVCNKEFLSKSGAKFHEKYQHIEAKLFCLICKKPFKFHFDLDRHMKTHTGIRPFECHDCDKTFVCKSSLMQHVRLKHIVGNIYKCSVCDKSFCTEADLKRHEAVHSDTKPFKCDKCAKTFTCKSSLNVHRKTHLGKKYACQFCNMHFHTQADLQRHVTIHTGERPWLCNVCSKGYSCKSTLTVHIKHMHTKHPTPNMYLFRKPSNVDSESKEVNPDSDDSEIVYDEEDSVSLEEEDRLHAGYKVKKPEKIPYENMDEIDDSEANMIVDSLETTNTGFFSDWSKTKPKNSKKLAKVGKTKGVKKKNSNNSRNATKASYYNGTTVNPGHTDDGTFPKSSKKGKRSDDVKSFKLVQSEPVLEIDNPEQSTDPYKSIDKLNKETQNADVIFPVEMFKSNKRRRKAKFVRKMEISDGYVILQN